MSTELAAILNDYPRYGLKVEGILDDVDPGPISIVPWLGPINDLVRIIEKHSINVILVADGKFDEDELLELVRCPASRSCELLVVPRLHHLHTLVGLPDHIGSIPVMRISSPSLAGFAWTLKRTFDVIICTALLLTFWPVLLLCAIAVRLEGGRGVLFRQQRVGKNGKTFACFKFRSMKPVDSHEAETQWSIANDGRVGKVGRVLRKTSLDELPQLWNILRGDMTLVGPRPCLGFAVSRYLPWQRMRCDAVPGMTGLWQVSGKNNTTFKEMIRLDIQYVRKRSFGLDLKIILRTLPSIFKELTESRYRGACS
jgi:exopolysaccharide biosynthesis polyprenyl glycosylphosphotransferase